MTLTQAYQTLNLQPPLDFERAHLNPDERGVGSTTRATIMAILYVLQGGRIQYRTHDTQHTKMINYEARKWIRVLGGSEDDTKRFVACSTEPWLPVRGERVFYDHLYRGHRVLGPFSLAEWFTDTNENTHCLYDRDMTLLGEVTRKGLQDLRKIHCVEMMQSV